MTLPPHRSTFHSTSEEVEYGSDCSNMAVNIQLFPMRISPFFLFRCGHTNPKQIRVSSIDGINNRLIVLIRELWLIRRRVGHHLQMRIHLSRPLHNQVEHFLRTTHKHHRTTLFLQFFHFEREQVPSRDTFLRLALRLNPLTRFHDAHPIRNQHITIHQRLSKERVLASRIIRMSIYSINEQFALWQRGEFRLTTQNIQRF